MTHASHPTQVHHFKSCLEAKTTLAMALKSCPVPVLSDGTVGEMFESAREAGYEGIAEQRQPKPRDREPCPICKSKKTWESHDPTNNEGIYCRDLMCESNS